MAYDDVDSTHVAQDSGFCEDGFRKRQGISHLKKDKAVTVHAVTLCLRATKSTAHACVMSNGRELNESRATNTCGFGHSGSAVLRDSNECSRKH